MQLATLLTVLLLPVLAQAVQRDPDGRIHRSREAVISFKRMTICPSTGKNSLYCPGYIVDHIKPLACNGADDPSNMQYQTIADAHAKDLIELEQCGKHWRKWK